jgi:signal peptidase II
MALGSLWGSQSARGLAVVLTTFALDQATKTWLLFRLASAGGFGAVGSPSELRAAADLGYATRGPEVVTPFFDIVMAWNIGVSYGLFAMDSATGQYGLAAFKVIVSCVLWVWLARSTSALTAVALGLIVGGALGNAVDRVLYLGVADFFSLHLRAIGSSFHWYVFNVADVAIVAGVGALLYESVVPRRSDQPANAVATPKPAETLKE